MGAALTSPAFGLVEIKREVATIERDVGPMSSGVAAVQAAVLNPTYGLQAIQSEVGAMSNELAGLNRLVYARGPSIFLTTGPFFVQGPDDRLELFASNATSSPQTITFTLHDSSGANLPIVDRQTLHLNPQQGQGALFTTHGKTYLEVRAQLTTPMGVYLYTAHFSGRSGGPLHVFKASEWLPMTTGVR
jgi:hypothetical protein